MSNNRLFILIASAALALTAILAGETYITSGSTQENIQPYSDQGDAESNSIMPPSMAASENGSSLTLAGSDWIERHPTVVTGANRYTGSDWIERHPSGVNAGNNGSQAGDQGQSSVGSALTENNHTYAGTGDPLRYRARPSKSSAAIQENGHTYAGTGDPSR